MSGMAHHPAAVLANGRAAPVPSPCLAGVTRERPVLDRLIRHIEPVAIDIHLHARWSHAVRRRPTIMIIAATHTGCISQVRVDVVGFRRKLRIHREYGDEEGELERASST
jgi:hypothetical protein